MSTWNNVVHMNELKITENGIYYFDDYIPVWKWKWEKYKDNLGVSKLILDYKEGLKIATAVFTSDFEDALIYLSNKILYKNVTEIALVAVPPSEVDKYSPIRNSINKIVEKFDNGEISDFKYVNKIHNCSNLLLRIRDVESNKYNKRKRVFFDHYSSIDFDEDLVEDLEDVVFIIMDDITTEGFTMHVCEEILMDYGISEDNIYKLVIAETVDD